jgi:hypothetical protein
LSLRTGAALLVFAVSVASFASCSVLPSTETNTPTRAVQEYVGRIVAHDLSSLRVCNGPYPHGYSALLIGGIFAPVQALPGLDPARTLSVIDLDPTQLTFAERSRTDDEAVIEIGGTLLERFEPSEVEALFRAYAAEAGQEVELDLLQETLRNVSNGPVELDVREEVRVILEGGRWRVCPPAFTP